MTDYYYENINNIDEHDIIIFEDNYIKFINNEENSESENESETSSILFDINYEVCMKFFNYMTEHFFYIDIYYFDQLTHGNLHNYFVYLSKESETPNNFNFDLNDDLEFKRYKKKNPKFEDWVMYYFSSLKESYKYLNRLSERFNCQNNTFYEFCRLGFDNSSSSKYLI